MRRLLLPILALVLFAAGPARADSFDDATAGYDKGDYATTMQFFPRLAEQGDAEAQAQLAADAVPDLANDPVAIEALVRGIAGLLAARVDPDHKNWQQPGR